MKRFYIYKMIHLPSGRVYIGQHKLSQGQTPENDSYHGSGTLWRRIYKKHPDECVKVVIDYTDTKDEINELEKKYIAHYRAVMGKYCVNLADGGYGVGGALRGIPHSEEHKRKIGEAQKGKIISESQRKKMSERMKGNIPWNKGKTGIYTKEQISKLKLSLKGNKSKTGQKLSEETKRKIAEKAMGRVSWNKGKKMSEESRRKLSESCKGRKMSDETKQKISKAMTGRVSGMKGKTPWNKGKKHSPESIEKMKEAAKKRSVERDEFGRFKKKGTLD